MSEPLFSAIFTADQGRAMRVLAAARKGLPDLADRLDSWTVEDLCGALIALEFEFKIGIEVDEAYAATTVEGLLCLVEGKLARPGAMITRPGQDAVYDFAAIRQACGRPIMAERFPASRVPPRAAAIQSPTPEPAPCGTSFTPPPPKQEFGDGDGDDPDMPDRRPLSRADVCLGVVIGLAIALIADPFLHPARPHATPVEASAELRP